MKKFLIASTAVVALAGTAAAEITFSGDAQIGLKYDNRLKEGTRSWDPSLNGGLGDWVDTYTGDTRSGWNVQSRARFKVTMTGETDSGLSFGVSTRTGRDGYTESRDKFVPSTSVWMEGAYGKLAVGDVDSAIEQAIGDLTEVGNSGLEFYNEMWYTATDAYEEHDNKGVVYSYKYGDASFYASFEDKYIAYSGLKYEGDSWALGASYDVQQYSFGIGYSQGAEPTLGTGDWKTWAAMASGEFNGLTVKGVYIQSKDDVEKVKQYGIGADYAMSNGLTLKGFYRINDWDVKDSKEKIAALGASYDLGGGASLNGGVVYIKDDEAFDAGKADWKSRTIADFGVKFSF